MLGPASLLGVSVVSPPDVGLEVIFAGLVCSVPATEPSALRATVDVTAIAGSVDAEATTAGAAANNQPYVQLPSPGRKLDRRIGREHARGIWLTAGWLLPAYESRRARGLKISEPSPSPRQFDARACSTASANYPRPSLLRSDPGLGELGGNGPQAHWRCQLRTTAG